MGTLLSGLLGLAVLALAIAWVLLPVIIVSKMNEALKVLRETRADIAAMRRYYEPDPRPALTASERVKAGAQRH